MVLVLAEHRHGQVRNITYELLDKAGELADSIGEPIESLQSWADTVVVSENEGFTNGNPDAYRQALGQLIEDRSPSIVLLGHTSRGLDIAPTLAAELDRPIITNLEDCYWENDELVTERSIYDDRIRAVVRPTEGDPVVVTAQAATFSTDEPTERGRDVVEFGATIDQETVHTSFLEYIEPETGDVDIASSDVLVSVGRGIEDEENLDIIEGLADAMGADIAGSRPVIDNGWLPDDRQVGQSGKTVAPDLYLAIGISGASQHVIGMKGADTIVAINKDPNAPIFEIADFGIVDDLFDVVPALTEEIRERR
ncbi:MAG: electron transfer flavoprotein subunit alpha/FixB family protein [Halobacteriales archaeon]